MSLPTVVLEPASAIANEGYWLQQVNEDPAAKRVVGFLQGRLLRNGIRFVDDEEHIARLLIEGQEQDEARGDDPDDPDVLAFIEAMMGQGGPAGAKERGVVGLERETAIGEDGTRPIDQEDVNAVVFDVAREIKGMLPGDLAPRLKDIITMVEGRLRIGVDAINPQTLIFTVGGDTIGYAGLKEQIKGELISGETVSRQTLARTVALAIGAFILLPAVCSAASGNEDIGGIPVIWVILGYAGIYWGLNWVLKKLEGPSDPVGEIIVRSEEAQRRAALPLAEQEALAGEESFIKISMFVFYGIMGMIASLGWVYLLSLCQFIPTPLEWASPSTIIPWFIAGFLWYGVLMKLPPFAEFGKLLVKLSVDWVPFVGKTLVHLISSPFPSLLVGILAFSGSLRINVGLSAYIDSLLVYLGAIFDHIGHVVPNIAFGVSVSFFAIVLAYMAFLSFRDGHVKAALILILGAAACALFGWNRVDVWWQKLLEGMPVFDKLGLEVPEQILPVMGLALSLITPRPVGIPRLRYVGLPGFIKYHIGRGEAFERRLFYGLALQQYEKALAEAEIQTQIASRALAEAKREEDDKAITRYERLLERLTNAIELIRIKITELDKGSHAYLQAKVVEDLECPLHDSFLMRHDQGLKMEYQAALRTAN